jgi:hypothetical protein
MADVIPPVLACALVACSAAAVPSMSNTAPATREPATPAPIAVQLAYRGTFMVGPPFSQIPPFTLLDDGTLIWLDDGSRTVVMTVLPREEVARIRAHLIDLGFARLENHTDSCRSLPSGASECTSDASYAILRVRLPSGQLREVTTYAGYSNEPAIYEHVVDYLSHYPHPRGEPYRPTTAALHVRVDYAPGSASCPAIDVAILQVDPNKTMWAILLDGKSLDAVLAVAPTNYGKFVACGGNARFELTLVPGVPGADLSEEVGVYKR